MQDNKFQKLVREYFDQLIERYPEYGVYLGLHKYDGRWSEETKQKYLEDIKFLQGYLKRFRDIDSGSLSPQNRLDREIVIHDLNLSIFHLKELRFWESDPDILEKVGSILFLLLARENISFEQRIEAIIRGLEGVPEVLEQAKTRLNKPYKLWTEIAIQSCLAMERFLEGLSSLKVEKFQKDDLEKSIRVASQAIRNYKKFLEQQILPNSVEKYAIGRDKFEKLIQLRELDLTTEEILEIGEKTLTEDKEKLKKIAREIDPNLGIKEIKSKIEQDHPQNFNLAIRKYEEIVQRAKEFIADRDLMEIPEDEEVIVRETPEFLSYTIPFAAYFSPAKFDKKKIGIYNVTPPKGKILRRYNLANIANTSVHEAYPGHHLQLTTAYRNPSLVRTLSDATELIEGWAHYCEEYMREVGFNNKKEIKFIQALDEIWRAARVIIDIKLHTGEMNFEESVKFLVKHTQMEKEDALAEVKRYTKSPSYQLSYLTGKYLIKKLKADIKNKMKENFSDKFFHQVILNAGSIPVKYLKKEFEFKMKK